MEINLQVLADFEGMTLGMLRTLFIIRENPGRSIVELAEELQVDVKTAQFYCLALRRSWRRVTLVMPPLRPDRLAASVPVLRRTRERDSQRALIRCERSMLDQRRYEVRLTPAGIDFIKTFRETLS